MEVHMDYLCKQYGTKNMSELWKYQLAAHKLLKNTTKERGSGKLVNAQLREVCDKKFTWNSQRM